MTRILNKNFFHFLLIFVGFLSVSFLVLLFVGFYEAEVKDIAGPRQNGAQAAGFDFFKENSQKPVNVWYEPEYPPQLE